MKIEYYDKLLEKSVFYSDLLNNLVNYWFICSVAEMPGQNIKKIVFVTLKVYFKSLKNQMFNYG